MRLVFSQTIAASPETVFACLEDDRLMRQWMEGVEEIAYPDGDGPTRAPGTRVVVTIREGGRRKAYRGRILACEPPRRMTMELGDAGFAAMSDYRLTPVAGGTRLDYQIELRFGSTLKRVLGRLFGWLTRRIVRRQVAALTRLAESRRA